MFGLTALLNKFRSRDRRKNDRQETPQLSAYFWNNSTPIRHSIKDVSPTGFYLLTEERWYPGTLVMMTLQTEAGPGQTEKQAVAVQSKAVRWGDDGVGLMFMLPDKGATVENDPDTPSILKSDRKVLASFLQQLMKDDEQKRTE